jgi:hypothetical protein
MRVMHKLPVALLCRRNLLFLKNVTCALIRAFRPQEGRFAIVTIRGAGCDGRGSAQAMRAKADGQVVWFWLPDAGVKFADQRCRPFGSTPRAGDGG